MHVGDPEVIAEGYSVRVRLHPHPVVSRVVTAGQDLRPRPRPWLEREVAVGRFLASRHAHVVAPWIDPGPHTVDGIDVSLWEWVEHTPSTVSGSDFGVMLGGLHAILATYEAPLPTLVGPLTDIATALERFDDPVLHRAAAELVPLALTWPLRPLHGDAHTGNVLVTPAGPRWTDFEDVCVGPVEWDLASLTLADDAINAYPGTLDQGRLEDCRDLRRLQILSGLLVGGFTEPALRDSLVAKLQRRWRG
ncbi:aminoglycoside phosphotransferase family protein [Nocardioides sp. 503]|uniref:phosphotransferase n=1 Tax=Nocardioides sp. 503 TaxID=2508326 RepID=UPI001431439D|nr:aminoglycoside phosphotransferase family protein [Nocardioides sp. 503]